MKMTRGYEAITSVVAWAADYQCLGLSPTHLVRRVATDNSLHIAMATRQDVEGKYKLFKFNNNNNY